MLKDLSKDRVSSSNTIALKMLECAERLHGKYDYSNLIKDIMLHQPSMAVVLNIADNILSSTSISEISELKKDFLEAEQKTCSVAIEKLKKLKFKNVATISFSKTVLSVLNTLRPEMVYISISHPAREGERFAEELIKRDVEVTIFEDMAYSLVINNVETIIIGADAVFDDFVVNKIGSYYLAILARRFDIPLFVIANKYKILKEELRDFFRILPMKPGEITKLNCNVINVYFEEVPRHLITDIITGE